MSVVSNRENKIKKDIATSQSDEWHRNAESYIQNCQSYGLIIDPNVVISLQTGWDKMQPSKQFGEGAMLSLLGVLENNNHIKRLNLSSSSMQDSRFRAGGNGNSNARILNMILKKNQHIESLDISNTGLDDDGIGEICEGLKKNTSVKYLNLSYNHFGEIGAEKLRATLLGSKTIKKVDVSRNALGFRSIESLVCSCIPNGMELETHGNFVFEEILNSVSHGIAFILSVIAANVLVSDAADEKFTDYHFWACVLYSFSLMFLFLFSSLYHSFFMLPETSRIFQILDHIGIFMFIAGSYTPFLLIGLHHSTSARMLIIAQWICALIGSVFAACSDLNAPATTLVELLFFLIMGWSGFLLLPDILASFEYPALVMLGLGGVVYFFGIIFFILGEYKPIYHTIWHLFVVMGATLHWFDVYFFIIRTDIGAATLAAAAAQIEAINEINLNLKQCF